jgi:hypothetical protein
MNTILDCLCIAAGADLTRLMEWIAVGQERAQRIR